MEEQIFKLTIAAVVAVGAMIGGIYLAHKFRHEIRERVALWLRNHGLQQSALMDVLLVCDAVFGVADRIICKVFVKTQQTGKQKVSEQTYTLEEIGHIDSTVAAELQKRGHVEKSVLKQIA